MAGVLVVGSGAREHALARALGPGTVVAPGNPGMRDAARVVTPGWTAAPASDGPASSPPGAPVSAAGPVSAAALLPILEREGCDLVVVGPEAPLAAGLADDLAAAGVAVFGPARAAAALEGSKGFCREVATSAGVPMAEGASFDDPAEATAYARRLGGRVAVKADGLAAGKGVRVCASVAEAEEAIRAAMVERAFGAAGARVVVERALAGREVSVICLADATTCLALPAARDHKRLLDGDRGPNTGGMGAISPLPDVSDADVAALVAGVHRPVLDELAARGAPFRGALYAGLMLTADGPFLLEFNVRFGDPEAQSILPRLDVPLEPLLRAAARDRLAEVAAELGIAGPLLPVRPEATVAVVLAAEGYPEAPRSGDPLPDLASARDAGCVVLCGGVAEGAVGGLRTAGGRVLTVVGEGAGLAAAAEAAYRGAELAAFPGALWRRDIGRASGGPEGRAPATVATRPEMAGDPGVIARYSLPAMSAIWTDEARFERMLRVELAVTRVLAARGEVPADALAAIEARAVVDVERIAELERTTDHDVIAFVSQVAERVGPEGRWLHLGLTSSDVVDTALALACREASDLLLADLDRLVGVLVRRARELGDVVQMGRTHGVHAEPITFGLKLATWAFELDRDRARLAAAAADLASGKISGPVGTYSSLPPDVEADALAPLGLTPDPVSTQVVQRDRHAAFLAAIAVTGGSIERFAVEVRNLQHSEIAEVQEPFRGGQKGSSAMPHKRNPILAERLTGMSRLLRGYALAGLEDQALWHERDISHSSVERVALPGATTLLDYMLQRFAALVEGLVVRPERMRENIERGLGLYHSSRVLTALVEAGLSREEAYAIVQRAALRAADERAPFRAVLEADPDVGARLAPGDLERAFDDASFLRHVPAVLARLDRLEPRTPDPPPAPARPNVPAQEAAHAAR